MASSIGARSQSARTYLEKNLESFKNASIDQLIDHALQALRDTLPAEDKLTKKNTTIAIVGKDQPFTVMDDDDVAKYVDKVPPAPPAQAST